MGADTRHVRGWLRRIAAVALAAGTVAWLAGCGGGPGGPNGGGGLWSSATGWFGGSKTIAVAPIIGATPEVSRELGDALVVAGKDRGLTLVTEGGKANYTLRGYLVATSEGRGAKITYIWDVNDADGSRVTRVTGEEVLAKRSGRDPWTAVDSAAIRSIAGKTTSQLAASVPGGRGSGSASAVAAAPATPAAPGLSPSTPASPAVTAAVARPKANGVLVQPVSGAPGDGQRSLTVALKKRLYAGGIKLANGPAVNVYTVKGSVKLADASGGKQSIRIDWQVLDPNGKKLGTVSQQNTIPKGSLNGPWGAIADAAAGAAADGILKLLPKSS
ncbi:MAG TPA: hypothetical protein VLB11_00125 [Methyloceanibacter sp.]|nr:hypothetical protein [Methyloceanibacter sp.]